MKCLTAAENWSSKLISNTGKHCSAILDRRINEAPQSLKSHSKSRTDHMDIARQFVIINSNVVVFTI